MKNTNTDSYINHSLHNTATVRRCNVIIIEVTCFYLLHAAYFITLNAKYVCRDDVNAHGVFIEFECLSSYNIFYFSLSFALLRC
jgi:hypothetical protein